MAGPNEQEQDRTEKATPFKLREARKRGQVAKSLEINSLLLLTVALAVSYFLGEKFITGTLNLSRRLLAGSGQWHLDQATVVTFFDLSYQAVLSIFWPFVAVVMITGILANMFQTGPVFSFFPLKPDMNRLNPVKGFKRLFSKKLLFESLKTLIKIFIFAVILYFAIAALLPKLMALIDTNHRAYPPILIDHARSLTYKFLLAILLVALLDLVYTRWDYAKQMRMSRRELKEEVKRREGDPQVRAKRRELQKEAVKRAGAVQKVPDADVLITNPTHLSVALKYDRATMQTPQIIAKGAGDLALKMRTVANKHRVPMVENKPLARVLFTKGEIGEGIPESQFPAVAKILAWLFLQREARLA